MRNISVYEKDYLMDEFEPHMVKYRRKQVLQLLSQYPHKRILEVGCGMEPLFEHIKNYEEYSLIEPSVLFYDNALDKAQNLKNVFFYQGFLEDTVKNLQNEAKFDFIVASSLLHEVENPMRFLNSVKLVMNKDTILHINVPNSNSLHSQLGVRMGLSGNIFEKSDLAKKMQRHSTFDTNQLIKFVRRYGFEVINTGGYFLKPFTYHQLNSMLNQEIITEKILDALYELGKEQPLQAAEIYINVKIK